jgi:hypothetical protein
MIEIEPIQLGLPVQEGIKILIRPLIGSTTDVTCNVYYEVLSSENRNLANGYFLVDEENYAAWGADNTFIEDLVLNKLGLTRKIIPIDTVTI